MASSAIALIILIGVIAIIAIVARQLAVPAYIINILWVVVAICIGVAAIRFLLSL